MNVGSANGGMGLGLSTANALVEALGGSIHIETEQNVGTKVTFSVVTESSERNTFNIASDRKNTTKYHKMFSEPSNDPSNRFDRPLPTNNQKLVVCQHLFQEMKPPPPGMVSLDTM